MRFGHGLFSPVFDYGFQKLCKGVHCVDLGESFQTHIYLQNLASIQPRTSPVKFAVRVVGTGPNIGSSSGDGRVDALLRPGGLNKLRIDAPDVPRVSAAYADQKPYADQRPYADQQNSGRSFAMFILTSS